MTTNITRRVFTRSMTASALALSLSRPAFAAGQPVRIGVVAPITGPLALYFAC